MRKIGFLSLLLVLSTISCGFFSSADDQGAPSELSPTEVSGALEPTVEVVPPAATDAPPTSESPKSPGKDVPIEPKPTQSQAGPSPAVTQMPVSAPEEGIPEGTEEIYYPFEVEQYQSGVRITLWDFRAYRDTFSGTETFIGMIMNSGSVDLIGITVHINALDENGVELASTKDLAHMEDFPTGSVSGFALSSRGDGFPDETDHLLIAFSGYERRDWHTNTREFEILFLDSEQEPDIVWGSVYNISAYYRSLSDHDTWLVEAGAILYN